MPPPPTPRNYVILICMRCEASKQLPRGVLPRCDRCKVYCGWRVAMDGEFTVSDRRFLKSLRIAADLNG